MAIDYKIRLEISKDDALQYVKIPDVFVEQAQMSILK